MIRFRPLLAALALGTSISLAACLPIGEGPDFSMQSQDGWVGLPVQELFMRPGIDAQLLAVCFDRSCPEPAALLTLRASGKDARDLLVSFTDPQALASLLNQRDTEDKGKTRQAIRTTASAERLSVAGLPAFKLSLIRADKPERSMFAVAVAKPEATALVIVLAIAAREEVALANAEVAAADLLQ